MRLKPGLTPDQAYEILSAAAALTWGLEAAAALQTHLRAIADSMQVSGWPGPGRSRVCRDVSWTPDLAGDLAATPCTPSRLSLTRIEVQC